MSSIWWTRIKGWIESTTSPRPIGFRDEHPTYGHGHFGRPLWTIRDRDAEEIRKVLRRTGCRDFTDRHEGFAVEGGEDGRPFYVSYPAIDARRARAALLDAGYLAKVDPDPSYRGQVLQVRLRDNEQHPR